MHQFHALSAALAIAALLTGCAEAPPTTAPGSAPAVSPIEPRGLIEKSLPHTVTDRSGWTTDMYAAFTVLTITPNRENVCAVVAVIEQESGFQVDPVIPGLGAIARGEINRRAERAHVPVMMINSVLALKSSDGHTYGDRIDNARTEKQLSDV